MKESEEIRKFKIGEIVTITEFTHPNIAFHPKMEKLIGEECVIYSYINAINYGHINLDQGPIYNVKLNTSSKETWSVPENAILFPNTTICLGIIEKFKLVLLNHTKNILNNG